MQGGRHAYGTGAQATRSSTRTVAERSLTPLEEGHSNSLVELQMQGGVHMARGRKSTRSSTRTAAERSLTPLVDGR